MNRNEMPAELLAGSPSSGPDAAARSAVIARADRVLAAILEATSPDIVRVMDVSGHIVRTNESAVSDHAATVPATIRALWERDRPQRAHDASALVFVDMPAMRALGGVSSRKERLMIRRPEGDGIVTIECNAMPLLDDDGKVAGAVTVDRVVAEAPRERAATSGSRALGNASLAPSKAPSNDTPADATRSATALIHDVNNALNTIMAAAFLAQHRADSPDAIRDYMGRITQAADSGAKAAALVERIVREASNSTRDIPGSEGVKPVSAEGSTEAGPLDILLVEDNPEGREFIGRLLRTAGHRVDAVATAAEARTRLDQLSSAVVDLLLTDLDLPDGNGLELAAYARRQRASLRIGVISGWDVNIGGEEAADAEFVLRKPLRAAALLDHVAGRQTRALPE